jgi:hypothetical protein
MKIDKARKHHTNPSFINFKMFFVYATLNHHINNENKQHQIPLPPQATWPRMSSCRKSSSLLFRFRHHLIKKLHPRM